MKDIWKIRTRSGKADWVYRQQSINKEYLKTQGYNWKRLGFIDDFELYQEDSIEKGEVA